MDMMNLIVIAGIVFTCIMINPYLKKNESTEEEVN